MLKAELKTMNIMCVLSICVTERWAIMQIAGGLERLETGLYVFIMMGVSVMGWCLRKAVGWLVHSLSTMLIILSGPADLHEFSHQLGNTESHRSFILCVKSKKFAHLRGGITCMPGCSPYSKALIEN